MALHGIQILRNWINNGEGPRLDFKTTINSPAKIAKSLVAFANSRGGKIVVGVEDKGFFVGVDRDGEKYELNKAAREFCSPAIELEYSSIEHQGKFALIAEVKESQEKPHYALNKKKENGKMYIRVADECIVPSATIEKMLKDGEMNFTYRTAAYHQTKNDLIRYLRQNNRIDIPTFAQWQKLSETNAQRMLVDYLLDGILYLNKKKPMEFSLA